LANSIPKASSSKRKSGKQDTVFQGDNEDLYSDDDNMNDDADAEKMQTPSSQLWTTKYACLRKKDAFAMLDDVDNVADNPANPLFPFFLTACAVILKAFNRTCDVHVRHQMRGVSWTENAQTQALFGECTNPQKNVGLTLKQYIYRFIPLAVGNLHFFLCFFPKKIETNNHHKKIVKLIFYFALLNFPKKIT